MSRFPISIVLVLASCNASAPGVRPHDMSAARHEQAARDEDRAAADAHARAYDVTGLPTTCRTNVPRPPICWTSVEHPNADHLRVAEQHRRRAAEHRAASVALRGAEARACVGMADQDRDISPFDRVEDIARVEPLTETISSKTTIRRTAGAIVTFRARPAMTAEWLQRVVDCHLARNAALGHVDADMPDCPLVLESVTARVSSVGNGFAIAVRSHDPAVAQEVLDRARRSFARGNGTVTSRRTP